MRIHHCWPAFCAALLALVFVQGVHAQDSSLQLETAQTTIEFTLGDVLHTVHGTFKLKNCTIHFDPVTGRILGAILVDATSGDSGNGSRDRKMHHDILESAKFTEISFSPSQFTGGLAQQGASHLEVAGQFRLHGQDHALTIPIDVLAEGQHLQLSTRFIIPYVQWGLKNPSNFLLRVSDKVTIDIHAAGHLVSPEIAHGTP
ncbi:MAG: YceI family protein [Candidatus Acidiferrales bacterium]